MAVKETNKRFSLDQIMLLQYDAGCFSHDTARAGDGMLVKQSFAFSCTS